MPLAGLAVDQARAGTRGPRQPATSERGEKGAEHTARHAAPRSSGQTKGQSIKAFSTHVVTCRVLYVETCVVSKYTSCTNARPAHVGLYNLRKLSPGSPNRWEVAGTVGQIVT